VMQSRLLRQIDRHYSDSSRWGRRQRDAQNPTISSERSAAAIDATPQAQCLAQCGEICNCNSLPPHENSGSLSHLDLDLRHCQCVRALPNKHAPALHHVSSRSSSHMEFGRWCILLRGLTLARVRSTHGKFCI
jgi:hypothetical protein